MTIEILIEELEALRTRLHVRALSPAQYQNVGWADRPLRQLIDQAREEQEAQSWTERHVRSLGELLPEPVPLRSMIADGAEASP